MTKSAEPTLKPVKLAFVYDEIHNRAENVIAPTLTAAGYEAQYYGIEDGELLRKRIAQYKEDPKGNSLLIVTSPMERASPDGFTVLGIAEKKHIPVVAYGIRNPHSKVTSWRKTYPMAGYYLYRDFNAEDFLTTVAKAEKKYAPKARPPLPASPEGIIARRDEQESITR